MPCIRGSEPSMHARPYQARQNQAKASHASEALSPACMHSHTRRGRAKPRREQGHEARAMHQRQRPPHASTAMHQRQRAQHACTAIRGEAEPSQGESEGVRPETCIRGSEPSMHAQPYEARRSQASQQGLQEQARLWSAWALPLVVIGLVIEISGRCTFPAQIKLAQRSGGDQRCGSRKL